MLTEQGGERTSWDWEGDEEVDAVKVDDAEGHRWMTSRWMLMMKEREVDVVEVDDECWGIAVDFVEVDNFEGD